MGDYEHLGAHTHAVHAVRREATVTAGHGWARCTTEATVTAGQATGKQCAYDETTRNVPSIPRNSTKLPSRTTYSSPTFENAYNDAATITRVSPSSGSEGCNDDVVLLLSAA